MRFLKKIAIIGQGYVGLPLAMYSVDAGWHVVGVDSSEQVVKRIKRGESHIEDVSHASIQAALNSGKYEITCDLNDVKDCEIVILCLPTPLDDSSNPDTSILESVCKSMNSIVKAGTLIISESTSYPTTLRSLIKPLFDNADSRGLRFAVAPERINPGSDANFTEVPRLVSGLDEESGNKAFEFYSSICASVVKVRTPEVAEMAKLLENTYRHVNIALINNLVSICDELNISIRDVVDAADSKPYGFMRFEASAGIGGHCIPVDPMYLLWFARRQNIALPVVEAAAQIHKSTPKDVANKFLRFFDLDQSDSVLILGVAYKEGLGDLRETPALQIASHLEDNLKDIYWYDPKVKEFYGYSKWNEAIQVKAAIIVTYQENLPIDFLIKIGTRIFDCTGRFKDNSAVIQL
jgi:UDP-N-acetyl-D-glucosamine dehydrogenase